MPCSSLLGLSNPCAVCVFATRCMDISRDPPTCPLCSRIYLAPFDSPNAALTDSSKHAAYLEGGPVSPGDGHAHAAAPVPAAAAGIHAASSDGLLFPAEHLHAGDICVHLYAPAAAAAVRPATPPPVSLRAAEHGSGWPAPGAGPVGPHPGRAQVVRPDLPPVGRLEWLHLGSKSARGLQGERAREARPDEDMVSAASLHSVSCAYLLGSTDDARLAGHWQTSKTEDASTSQSSRSQWDSSIAVSGLPSMLILHPASPSLMRRPAPAQSSAGTLYPTSCLKKWYPRHRETSTPR